MSRVRPFHLPVLETITPDTAIVADNGELVGRTTPTNLVDFAAPVASREDAEQGLDNSKRMTALRTHQAIEATAGTASYPKMSDGASVQEAVAVAATPSDLLASTAQYTVGSTIRTADGFIYEVAPADATDAHLTTAGGVKLYYRWDGYLNILALGADNSGANDCAPIIQKAIDLLKGVSKGGTIFFPNGTYRTEDELLIDAEGITFLGTGRRKVYPGVFVPGPGTLPTIMPVHTKTAAVRFYSTTLNRASSFRFADMNIATLETGDMPTCAFGFDGSGNFARDYTFDHAGIHGFTSAFDTFGSGGDIAKGLIKITNCAINRNKWIARTLTGQWNGFVFEKNEAGQNIEGGINIKAQSAHFLYNSLEGQPNVLRVDGTYRGCSFLGNYFELNGGDYTISLNNTFNAFIGANFWLNVNSVSPLRLTNDVGTIVDDRMVPSCSGSSDLVCADSAIDPTRTGNASAAFFIKPEHISNLLDVAPEVGGYVTGANSRPHYDVPDSAGGLITTSGNGLTAITKTGLSLPTGSYVAIAIAVSYIDDPEFTAARPPRFELRINSGASGGIHAAPFTRLGSASRTAHGRTILYFLIHQATAPVTGVQIYAYPFGINPPAGLRCAMSPVAIYDLGTTLPSGGDIGGSAIRARIPYGHLLSASAPPEGGSWPIGYRIRNASPASAGFEGWINTPAGWKTYGAISP